VDILPRFGNAARNQEVKCTAHLRERRISYSIVRRAVP